MKMFRLSIMLACWALCVAVARAEEFEKMNLIDTEMACNNPSGNEIKETRHVSAPEGKIFDKDSVKVVADTRSFTDAAGPSGCFLENFVWKTVNVPTKSKEHTVPVIGLVGFDVRAHADCGSGEARTWAHMAKNEHIRAICSIRASIYDLKGPQ